MNSFEEHKLLVVAPHPDDETLGCGGLISKVKRSGGEVYVLILTVGNIHQYGGKSVTNTRLHELETTMRYLKVDDYDVALAGDEYHLNLDKFPQRDLINVIENGSKVSVAAVKPTIIVLPYGSSTNQDHEAVYKAGMAVCRPVPNDLKPFPQTVMLYEQPEVFWSHEAFKPNLYIDISEHLDNKIEALSFYESQVRKSPHPRSLENIRRIAQLRGSEICVNAAEAYMALRMVF
jgi:LmbE family N-acetylglucosaminyl deacetylase